MTLLPTKRRTDPARTIGAVMTSCTGVGGAATISAAHGNSSVALLIFGATQIWGICELVCRLHLRWCYTKRYDSILRRATEHPDDQNLRTLLVDIASTHPDELGERLPLRHELIDHT